MPNQEVELDPVLHITADAIGQPGQRVFYIQGQSSETVITLLVEKIQLQSLVTGIQQFLKEIEEKFPQQAPMDGGFDEMGMHIQPPVDPLFRVGEMGLAYDAERDRLCLILKEIILSDMNPDDAQIIRFWCTREQILQMANWTLEVINRGRPLCPQCLEPMDPEGHFCPKKNGHQH
ncbi:MAG TPA: DUF3090 domain-containing protein [Anaerolineaceae bacterium]|jgi:uncharacterized repeat protein (TIGR03847 family)|nr:DUF3090 domain-containing protein [Anaerolineaceae bacterium]HQO96234.1 DUF3090 domain-containing protein [Anaerolineaceae bacterium]HQP60165.1 DUF3090 domain-containing protein [Anaerolineaceae bacterium]